MPNARIHDAVTIIFAPPVLAAAHYGGVGIYGSAAITAAFVFGGLMFGPDLDTTSRQYSRWGIFRFIWIPYSACFRHRSRWSHGLVFGTLIRVIYFSGALTLAAIAGASIIYPFTGGDASVAGEMPAAWRALGSMVRDAGGAEVLVYTVAGMWLGAASHTLTDMAGTYIKTGRITDFL